MILLIVVISAAIYFNYIAGNPLLYEYSKGIYSIRRHNKYLDIQSYICFNTIIWKSSKDCLMERRCLTRNKNHLKDILNEL